MGGFSARGAISVRSVARDLKRIPRLFGLGGSAPEASTLHCSGLGCRVSSSSPAFRACCGFQGVRRLNPKASLRFTARPVP